MMRRMRALLLLSFAVLSSGCGSSSSTDLGNGGGGTSGGADGAGGSSSNTGGAAASGGAGGQGGSGTEWVPPAEGECVTREGVCELTECAPALEQGLHAEPCEKLTFSSNPPTSGTHYDVWANFAKYDRPVPRGFLLHSLEHSGVVLSYNCAEAEAAGLDCDGLVASLDDFYDAWPSDPLCTASPHRLIVTPDPELDAPFAAAAWGHYLKGTCFDPELVSGFIQAYYGKNYENICFAGVDPFGGTYPETCGQ